MIPTILQLWLCALSLLLFLLMGYDKSAAKKHRRRIPESTLLCLAVLGGSVGGIWGMLLFRHKTRKSAFFLGFPAIALCEGLVLYLVFLRP